MYNSILFAQIYIFQDSRMAHPGSQMFDIEQMSEVQQISEESYQFIAKNKIFEESQNIKEIFDFDNVSLVTSMASERESVALSHIDFSEINSDPSVQEITKQSVLGKKVITFDNVKKKERERKKRVVEGTNIEEQEALDIFQVSKLQKHSTNLDLNCNVQKQGNNSLSKLIKEKIYYDRKKKNPYMGKTLYHVKKQAIVINKPGHIEDSDVPENKVLQEVVYIDD